MAEDDYDIIAYRILVYLYACKKREIIYDDTTFDTTVRKDVNEDYFMDVLRMMQDEGFISGLSFTKAWGNTYILISDIADTEITAEGVHYLENDNKMKRAGNILKDAVDAIAKLAGILGLFG